MAENMDEEVPLEDSTGHKKKSRGRTVGAALLVVLTVLLIGVAAPSLWLRTVILDEGQWVALTAPLADSPEIQQAVAGQVSAELESIMNVEQIAEKYLPDTAKPLAPYIATGANSFVDKEIQALVESPAFSSLWSTLCKESHPVVITALTGSGPNGVITTDAGTVTLNLDTALQAIQERLADKGFDFFADNPLGANAGDIVLFSSPALAQAQSAFNFLQGSIEVMLVLILVLGAAAVILAPQKRKAVLWLGMGTFIMMLILVIALHVAQAPLIGLIPNLDDVGRDAASAFYAIIIGPLLSGLRIVGVVGLVVGVIAIIAGIPALKDRVKNWLGTFSHNEKAAPFFRFVERHRNSAIIAGCVVAGVLIIFLFQGSFQQLLGILIGLIVWIALIGMLVAIERIEPPEPKDQKVKLSSSGASL